MATLLALLMMMTATLVKDYGVHGHTFNIEEADLEEWLKKEVQQLDAGQNHTLQQEIQEHYQNAFASPFPNQQLKEATSHSIHYFDPTITAKEAIKDHEGNILIEKGESYNPLNDVSLSQELLFFSGDNPQHLNWARALGENTKWILVRGHPIDLEQAEKRAVYFDQNGILSQKLEINAIPARVSQEDKRLKIETIPVEKCKK